MRLLRVAVLWAVAAFVAACQAAPAATVVTPATAANPTYAPVLDHLAIHSAAQANAVAAQALDLAGYPLGSRRLTGRPVAGLPVTGMITGAYTQVTLTRWESVPGTVADAAAWLVGHAAAGTGVVEQPGPDASLTWATARALHVLPFGLFAWLAPDGDHVDVTLTANVIWTPAKTPVETIPATVSQAVLDYRAGSNEFGTSSRRTVAGKDLSDLRTVINALPSAVPGVRSCPADNFESATVTMSYGGHRVVMQTLGDTCGDLWVTSDGHRQPDLGGGAYYVLQRLLASASPAPSGRQAARSLLDDVYSRSAAQVRAAALAKLVALPAAARRAGAPAALNPPENVAVSSSSYVWPTSVTGVVGYLESHPPGGFVVAHVGPGYGGVTDVVLQPAHVYPASSLVWLQLRPDGSGTRLRIDAEALWLPPRSPYELIPLGTPSARVTIYADGGAMKRARLTGKGVRAITRALDTSTTERAGLFSCRSSTAPTESLKLEVVYTVGPHHITFYWANGDCPVNAVVDGKRATYLTNPPTALVERLLHWH
ncbi:MAG: hypothetical protein QOE76_3169 [Frankiales bacterium]|nr:hypothetical protein [Frankiales bacterium]